ncbi:hypothetical protein AGOR_G00159590 [Albula goreensis]|uniref:Uncharacterized protein n=1 Tax=Albula goreensis TaxID=1534307 RepID=A0A8T3D070_9TELE|nr:hypothetical protein AGOR_G00159590 [Albula goreensis]
MCDTGEGLFTFQTREGDAIYQKVHTAALAIAEHHDWMTSLSKNEKKMAQKTSDKIPKSPLFLGKNWSCIRQEGDNTQTAQVKENIIPLKVFNERRTCR